VAEHNRLPQGEAAFNQLFRDYRDRAAVRGIAFYISKKKFRILTKQNCHYCGASATRSVKNTHGFKYGTYLYNGLDRVDSKYGYSIDNVVPCCSACNRGKSDMPLSEFEAYLDNLIKYRTQGVT
jgi:hypothetical protein